ncbi:hypothetical protein D3C81_1201110 [compost metagenome]
MEQALLDGPQRAFKIDADVLLEMIVLDGDHRIQHRLRDLLVSDGAAVLFRTKLANGLAVTEIGEARHFIMVDFCFNVGTRPYRIVFDDRGYVSEYGPSGEQHSGKSKQNEPTQYRPGNPAFFALPSGFSGFFAPGIAPQFAGVFVVLMIHA